MKRFFITLCAVLALSLSASAQTQVTRNGKTFEKVSTNATADKETGYTYKDSKGNEYPIYMGKTGSCYIKRTSKNTGKEYKQYLGSEISSQICQELGIDYTPKNK